MLKNGKAHRINNLTGEMLKYGSNLFMKWLCLNTNMGMKCVKTVYVPEDEKNAIITKHIKGKYNEQM